MKKLIPALCLMFATPALADFDFPPGDLETLLQAATRHLSKYPGTIKGAAKVEPLECDSKKIGTAGGRDILWQRCAASAYDVGVSATGASFPGLTQEILVYPWRLQESWQLFGALLAVMRAYDPALIPDTPTPQRADLRRGLDIAATLIQGAIANPIVESTVDGVTATYQTKKAAPWAFLVRQKIK
jgi:hypothetical protein